MYDSEVQYFSIVAKEFSVTANNNPSEARDTIGIRIKKENEMEMDGDYCTFCDLSTSSRLTDITGPAPVR